jgi:dihydrofolate reductase
VGGVEAAARRRRRGIGNLKGQAGGDILVTGSVTLVRSLLLYGFLDELSVMVCPVLVGVGKHLFEHGGHSVSMTLVESRAFANGVLSLTYQPAGD